MRTKLSVLLALLTLLLAGNAFAQYTKAAGASAPKEAVTRRVRGDDGKIQEQTVYVPVAQDRWGNAQGNANDLAVDGAFDGQTIAVIQLYNFDFELAKAALKEKGFSTYRWTGRPPSPDELEKALAKSCQLWIISDGTQFLTAEHLRVIKKFFEDGHGLYIWGDNQPYYADANFVGQALFGATMTGDLFGDQTVGLQSSSSTTGLKPNHLLTTGLEHIYEGITIATIQPNDNLEPLIYGSAGNLVAAYYDKNGRRAIFDGGFTRLYNKWDTAGTARYVKNAAAWLVNAERFGDAVVSPTVRTKSVKAPVSIDPQPAITIAAPQPSSSPWIAKLWIALVLAGATLVLLILVNVPVPNRRD